ADAVQFVHTAQPQRLFLLHEVTLAGRFVLGRTRAEGTHHWAGYFLRVGVLGAFRETRPGGGNLTPAELVVTHSTAADDVQAGFLALRDELTLQLLGPAQNVRVVRTAEPTIRAHHDDTRPRRILPWLQHRVLGRCVRSQIRHHVGDLFGIRPRRIHLLLPSRSATSR